jgi:hypothetical protein
MTNPDLEYLRKLLGDEWVDKQIFGPTPKHLLGRWQKKTPDNPWVRHTETLAKFFFTSERIKFNPEVLSSKLKAEYVSTLAEMESAQFIAQQGFSVIVEPTAPDKGPDLQAEQDGVPYFVEIRAVGFSEEEERIDAISNQIFSQLKAIPSSYVAQITIGDSYTANSPELHGAIAKLIDALKILKEGRPQKATFYYSASDDPMLNPGGDFDSKAMAFTEKEKRCQAIADKADFIVRFRDQGTQQDGTPASLARQFKVPPEPVNTHERLKKILLKKKNQLPKDSRGIIVLEVSELFMLDDFSVESALYGDLLVHFAAVTPPGQEVGELVARRNNRGFFRQTSRVSAIVIHRRTTEEGQVRDRWQVYPTNRANPDTIRLSLAELRRLGELEGREHLSAENAIDASEDAETGQQ